MKVVVDTNVLLSSLLSAPTGTLNRLLDQIRTSHTLVLSLAMAVELGAVIFVETIQFCLRLLHQIRYSLRPSGRHSIICPKFLLSRP